MLERDLLKMEKMDPQFIAMTLIMANKIIEKEKLEELWEEIKMYDIDILDIARQKGKEEGKEEGTLLTARELLVNALFEKFSIVPFRISEQITSIGNAQSQWLRNDLRPVFEEKVFSADGFSLNYLDKGSVSMLWKDHLGGSGICF